MRNLLAVLLLLSCSAPSAPPELDPVFVILCSDVDPEEPHHPCCTGFALGTQVVTANHCVPGDTAEIVSNRQWLDTSNASQVGVVVARDPVRALTRSAAKAGTVGERAGLFWRTDLDTAMGDSGAAIVDASGAAVGVLSRCLTADGKEC